MRWIGIVRILVILFTLLTTWYFAETIFSAKWEVKSLRHIFDKRSDDAVVPEKTHSKCGNEKNCPDNYFAFKIISGAASVVGPTICLEDKILMSSVKNNIGRGLNMALVNASTGELKHTGHYDMYSGDVKDVKLFLEKMTDGTLIFLASFDDPATKLDVQARELFSSYGSSFATKLGFRDSWTFVGGKGIKHKSPFEQHIKNDKETNKYDGWPEVLEMEGCIPRKMD
ncbi:PREDICTED: protein FAM3D [Nanorana parkeri]|uniref:protein FAM3D n=1 Tax=Nanorana parkeri TaxID=125878 RepID=UPI000854F510|nr:PREDICTED: protein FAM3D [Nanorana parkeri]